MKHSDVVHTRRGRHAGRGGGDNHRHPLLVWRAMTALWHRVSGARIRSTGAAPAPGVRAVVNPQISSRLTHPSARTIIIVAVAIAVISLFFVSRYNPRFGLLFAIRYGTVCFADGCEFAVPYRWILTVAVAMVAYALIVRTKG